MRLTALLCNAGNSMQSGRLCDNPYDNGLLPDCNGTIANLATDTGMDPRTDGYIPYFPYYVKQADLGNSIACGCNFTIMKENYGTCANGCTAECAIAPQTPAFLGGSTVCAPWAYTFGFFTGEEETDGDPDYSKDLTITLDTINMDTGSQIGNFISGEGKVIQQYPSALNGAEPWIAFFTGGDRIGKARDKLQNNYGGRFRLEVSVNLECHEAGRCWQRSPRATSLPVVPIPYTPRNEYSLYDFSFSTFRIAAYDPDFLEQVFYFHASNQKYGVHVGHGIPEGDYPNNPFPKEYNNARLRILEKYCNSTNCDSCPKPLPVEGEGGTVQIIEDFCEEYPEWKHDNVGLHTAGPPKRLMIDAYTGVVHWQTGASPVDDDTGTYTMPPGFSAATPGSMTPYTWTTLPDSAQTFGSSTNAYDGYVYDPETFTYMPYSEYSKCPGSNSGSDCTTSSLAPGFYNLVVDIRSESGDSCLSREIPSNQWCLSLEEIMTSNPADQRVSYTDPMIGPFTPIPIKGLENVQNSKRGYNSIPLDFLLYLYPAMSMCSNCNGGTASQYLNEGVKTFKDSTGTYGFDVTNEPITAPNVAKYIHDTFEGTGRCIICGGSETNTSQIGQDPSLCTACLVPDTSSCTKNTRPFWINKDPTLTGDPYTPAPPGWGPTDTYPSGNINIEPTWGEMKAAEVSAYKGTVVEFDLVAGDEDACVELWIYDTGLYKGDELDYCRGFDGDNADACAILDNDGDGILDLNGSPDYPELNMFDMHLGPHQPAYIANYVGTKPSVLGEPGKTVRRKFSWPVTAWPDNLDAEHDPRPSRSSVCFFAFDGYLFSDFRCVRITLNTEQQIYWSDRRPGLNASNIWNVVQDREGFITGSYNDIDVGSIITSPLTLANQTKIIVNVGDLVTFDMQARQSSGYDPLDIFVSQGVLPDGATFVRDTTFDGSKVYSGDPVRYTFSWRPKKGQECEYQICFLASNIRGTEYPMTVGYNDLEGRLGPAGPSRYSYTP
eukprot:scaffold8875_cov25-Prasinocladus_malaysianus.AAC.2